jgi:hypothetical protein
MVFCFVQNFFFGQHESYNIFFFQNLILDYDKNSESDYYFFPPPKSEYFLWSFPNDAVYNTGLLYSIESVICRSHLSSAINAIYIISTCYGIHGNIAYLCPRVHFLEGMEEILYPLCRDLRSGDHLV